MDFNEELTLASCYADELTDHIADIQCSFPPGAPDQTRMALAFLHHAISLGCAVIELLKYGNPGPAITLERPLFEGHLRGEYFAQRALSGEDDGVVKEYFDKPGSWPVRKLLKKIEDGPTPQLRNWFHDAWMALSSELNDSAHCGLINMARITPTEVQPDYPLDRKLRVMRMAVVVVGQATGTVLMFKKGDGKEGANVADAFAAIMKKYDKAGLFL